jgi:NAD+ kinase
VKVGIIANTAKAGALATIERLKVALASHGLEVLLEKDTADFFHLGHGLAAPELAEHSDLIAVLGGDGTMLNAMAKLGDTAKPLAGINIGTLGFLTTCMDDAMEELVEAIAGDNFTVSRHTLLNAKVVSADGSERNFIALNEVVLARGQTGRLVSLAASVNGEFLNHYRADGLILATPTGSTAYSLSAGGPLISPTASVFVITPVCPHTLSQRSLVLDDSSVVELFPDEPYDCPMIFTADGRDVTEIGPDEKIEVRKSSRVLNLVSLKGHSFYEALRVKLGWRGG